MGFGQFLTDPEVKVIIVTHRDAFQSMAMELSKFDQKYMELSSVITLDSTDANKIGVKSNDNVLVKNNCGNIVIRVSISPEDHKHPGIAFMINSPWSNALVGVGVNGVPNFKNIEAIILKSKDKKITLLKELIT